MPFFAASRCPLPRSAIIQGMRRLFNILAVALITAGGVILTDAAITLAWEEPLTALYTERQQSRAAGELDDIFASFKEELIEPEKQSRPGTNIQQSRRRAAAFAETLEQGKPIGRIEEDSADIDLVVLEGTDTETLKGGPGHYPETALPGQGKTIGIAGHRTTYGAPFSKLDEIEVGDRIVIEMPYGTYTYRTEKTKIVDANATEVVRDIGRERLVLTACHPRYSAAQRYVIFGELVEFETP